MNGRYQTKRICHEWRVYQSIVRGAVWAMFLAVSWGLASPLAVASDMDPTPPKQSLGVGLDVQTVFGQKNATSVWCIGDSCSGYEEQRPPFALGGHLRVQRGRIAYEPSFRINTMRGVMELGARLRFGVAGTRRTMLELILDPKLETHQWILPTTFKLDWGLAVTHRVNDLVVVSLNLTNNLFSVSWNSEDNTGLNLSLVPIPSASLTFIIPPSPFSKPKRKRSKRSMVK